jgi:hypothetical protein
LRRPEPSPTAPTSWASPAAGFSADLGILASSSDESLLIAPSESSASSDRGGSGAVPSRRDADGGARARDDSDEEDKKDDEEGPQIGEERRRANLGGGADPIKSQRGDRDPDSLTEGARRATSETGSDTDALHREEEDVLNLHMRNIQENAGLLSFEGTMLQEVQRDGAGWDDVDRYARTLEAMLDRREDMIREMRPLVDALVPRLLRRQQTRDQS